MLVARLLISNNLMVREINATWNPVYDSILIMYQKLRDLDFTIDDPWRLTLPESPYL